MADVENAPVAIAEAPASSEGQTSSRSSGGKECYVLDEFVLKEPLHKKEYSRDKQKNGNDSVTAQADHGDKDMIDDDKAEGQGGAGNSSDKYKNKSKQSRRGNKNRPVFKTNQVKVCSAYLDAEPGTQPDCGFTNCKFTHDLKSYVESKPQDIGETCYVFSSLGYCPRGVTCRFAGQHIDQDFRNIKNKEIYTGLPQEKNHFNKPLTIRLRKKEYDFSKSDKACDLSFDIIRKREEKEKENIPEKNTEDAKEDSVDKGTNDFESEPATKKIKISEDKPIGYAPEEDLIKLRPQEKKKLDFTDKLYLAPLTTVGNLPFRRLCKKLGADITCSEMAMGLPLLQGTGAEWALVQRHVSEDFYGVQLCGCSPPQMARVAQLIEENIDCDFVDINMGCPIDLVFKKGMGSGLMIRNRPVEVIARTMSNIMSRPLTIKMRTGVYKDKNIAHNLFPKLEDLGVAALTIHGRSREQRYTRLADWDYIAECKKTVDIPVFGNGDILNYEDYISHKTSSGVDGIMIARGALIKPWIFTEIKEGRHWDISAQERLDIFKDFANFGLEHWGSDDRGLETTRKFLLEWLSFTYRYVPFGILKHPPQRINERLPMFRGRNDLETLLSSPNSQDWVKITEMFLGKVKDGFEFLPRHKANSYS